MTGKRGLINPDTRAGVALTATAVGVVALSVFTGSATALIAVAEAGGINPTWAWIGPAGIDGAIVAFTATALAMHHRGRTRRMRTLWALIAFTTILSAGFNAAHGLGGAYLRHAGIALVASLPVLLVAATKALEWLAVASPADLAERADQEIGAQEDELDREDALREHELDLAAEAEVRAAAREATKAERIAVAQAKARARAAAAIAKINEQHPVSPAPPAPVVERPACAPQPDRDAELAARNAEILQRIAAGESQKAVATAMGIGRATVQRVVNTAQTTTETDDVAA